MAWNGLAVQNLIVVAEQSCALWPLTAQLGAFKLMWKEDSDHFILGKQNGCNCRACTAWGMFCLLNSMDAIHSCSRVTVYGDFLCLLLSKRVPALWLAACAQSKVPSSHPGTAFCEFSRARGSLRLLSNMAQDKCWLILEQFSAEKKAVLSYGSRCSWKTLSCCVLQPRKNSLMLCLRV